MQPNPTRQPLLPVARGLALFLGLFASLNLLGEALHPHFDANLWWIDLRRFSPLFAQTLLLASSLFLVAFAVRPPRSLWRRAVTSGCVAALLILTLSNTTQFYALLARSLVHTPFPMPLSLLVSSGLGLILASLCLNRQPPTGSRSLPALLAVTVSCAVGFPLAQMWFFGKTDYRRPADAAVVLGARVYRDGRLSDALADRMRTACQLYHQGLVRRLVFSGGPGDGAIHETEGMKRFAVARGVRPEDIWLDPAGFSTQATVRNTQHLFRQWHAERVLVVSHAYHLPRIKLCYQRAGWDVLTVPAKESYLLRQMPYNMAREVVALWAYYVRPLANA